MSWHYFKSSVSVLKKRLQQSGVIPLRACGKYRYDTIGEMFFRSKGAVYASHNVPSDMLNTFKKYTSTINFEKNSIHSFQQINKQTKSPGRINAQCIGLAENLFLFFS